MTDPVPADRRSDLGERYVVGAPVGSAGVVDIHTGVDRRLDREVAIKLLREDLAEDPERRAAFESAATIIAAAAHPNVLTIYDVGSLGGRPCVVSEQVVGTFADEMASGPVDEERVAQIALDCLAALELAHSAGLVHGSIEPGAIAIGDDGSAKLGDFLPASAPSDAGGPGSHERSPAADVRRLAATLNKALVPSSPPAVDSVAGVIARAASAARGDRFERASDFSSAIRGAADPTSVIPIGDDPTLEETTDEPIAVAPLTDEPVVVAPLTDEPMAAAPLKERLRTRWRSIGASDRRRVVLALVTLAVVALLVVAASGDDDPPTPGTPAPQPTVQDGLPPEVPQRRGGR